MKEKNTVWNRILTIVGSILCVILIPVLIINVTLIIKSYTNPDEVPSVGGTFPLIVLTDSMYPEFESGDLIICHTKDAEEIKSGEIIAFFDPSSSGTAIVSHRVIDVVNENGEVSFKTKGDANNAEDTALVPAEKLVGVYKLRLKGLGNVALFMQTTQGLVICVVCPILLFVIYDYLRRRHYEKANKEDTEKLKKELEELRKQANKD